MAGLPHLTDKATITERRNPAGMPVDENFIETPLYTRIKKLTPRAPRLLAALAEILNLMENATVVWQLKGKLARGGFTLMPENENTPPEMAAKLAYTELETLRLKLNRLVLYPPAASAKNPDPLNALEFSAEGDLDILHAIRREAANFLTTNPEDTTFHELKNLCQLAIGNLQQMQGLQKRRFA